MVELVQEFEISRIPSKPTRPRLQYEDSGLPATFAPASNGSKVSQAPREHANVKEQIVIILQFERLQI
jgi:hypothetical protein